VKRVLITLTAIILGVCLSYAGERIEKEFDVSPGEFLEMNLETGGSIDIMGWDDNKISVKAYLSGSDYEDCNIEFDKKSGGLEILSSYDHRRRSRSSHLEFEIRVPKRFDLDIETNGGDITVENVEGKLLGITHGGDLDLADLKGDIRFKTNGGNVECHGLSGEADLKTNGGSITCTDSEINGEAHTNGGNVNIRNVSGDFECTTNGGQVSYENDDDFSSQTKTEVIRINTMGGDIDVDNAPLGADLHTNGGDIEIKSAGRFVEASTNGGNIYIGQIDGWVDVGTNGGDVTVTVIGKEKGQKRDIDLRSNGGEIDLNLPADFSADFDIELAYTKNRRRDYKIISDFDLKLSGSDEWQYDWGTARKFIEGKGIVKDGRNKIRIATINGDVVIRKNK
jgi:DUF4097 and DUF4098 domain-containing protein YvlB